MGKFKEGDFVKAIAGDESLDIAPNEVGKVVRVGSKESNGDREVSILFVDYDGEFDFTIEGAASEFEKVGTKIKWVKPPKIEVGSLVLVGGDEYAEAQHLEVFKVEQIDDEWGSLEGPRTLTFSGEGYEVTVTGKELKKKVPVIV